VSHGNSPFAVCNACGADGYGRRMAQYTCWRQRALRRRGAITGVATFAVLLRLEEQYR